MIRRSFALLSALTLVALAQATPISAQESRPSYDYPDDEERYSDDELDNLVSAIALYPDALLAQVLVAATFPDQVEEAARFIRSNGTDDIDDQPWDVSVKAVAHYPSALNMMADKGDWTTALGRAYATQSSDVMQAVQRMRRMADEQGNLRSNEQQSVSRDDDYYVIAPAQPRVIYVPVYDPYVIYTRPIFGLGYSSRFWSFGIGFPIGGWLSYDVNWRSRSVYYNGWDSQYYGYAGGWRGRSRPYIRITNIYINPRYRNVYINRDVIRRRVVYRNVDRYPGVHRDTRFARRDAGYRGAPDRGRSNGGRADGGRNDGGRIDRGRYDGGQNDRSRSDGGRNDRSRSDVGRSDVGRSDVGRSDAGRNLPDRGRSDRGVNPVGTWGRDGNAGRSASPDGNRDANAGRDRRGGGGFGEAGRSSAPRDVPRNDPRADRGGMPDRGRGDVRSGDRGRSPEAGRGRDMSRAPRGERNDGPMINPRRAEGQTSQAGGGRSDGGRGGDRGGDRGSRGGNNGGGNGRGRPNF